MFLLCCIRQTRTLTASTLCLLAFGVHDVFAASDGHDNGHHGGSADHHAESSAGLPQLDVSTFPGQIFWLVVTFIILYFFFSKKTLPEISNVLENRKRHIESDLGTAEEMKTKAGSVQDAYEESLKNARRGASEAMAAIHNEMKARAEEACQKFRDRSEKEIRATEGRILKAQEDAMEEMNVIAAEIAREAAQKIVGITTDIEKVKTVVKSINDNNKAKAA